MPWWAWLAIALVVLAFFVVAIRGYPEDGAF